MAEAHLVPKIIQWTQHDPLLAEELKTNIPSWSTIGNYIFVKDPEKGFIPCMLSNELGSDPLQVVTDKGVSLSIKKSKYDQPGMTFPLLDPKILGNAFDDLVNLDELNEATILHSLRLRFQYDRFYTSVGKYLKRRRAMHRVYGKHC